MATLKEFLKGRSYAEVKAVAHMCGYSPETMRVLASTGRPIPLKKALAIHQITCGEVSLISMCPSAERAIEICKNYIKDEKEITAFLLKISQLY